jgi:hypothetical protein
MSVSCLARALSTPRFVGSCALIVALGGASACGSSQTVGAADPNAAFAVELTKASVSIVNQTKTSLAGGTVNLIPVGFPRPYFVMLPRMTSGEKRTFPLETFRMADGTGFRLNVTRVKSIQISAKDVVGTMHELEVPVD